MSTVALAMNGNETLCDASSRDDARPEQTAIVNGSRIKMTGFDTLAARQP